MAIRAAARELVQLEKLELFDRAICPFEPVNWASEAYTQSNRQRRVASVRIDPTAEER